jgi:ATP-dependent helicase Lhr and Lhr-like helicase
MISNRSGLDTILAWFKQQGWKPFDFQLDVWRAFQEGKSGLIHSATGTGKTYGAWMGPLIEALEEPRKPGLKVLWITPLRALAADTVASLQYPLADLGLSWRVETRTGDTSAATRSRQAIELPDALVTTPESLSLMLGREDAESLFDDLRCLIVDEWHELMSTKRGVQTELAMARVRRLKPDVRIWGVSATLGNLDDALDTLLGSDAAWKPTTLVEGKVDKEIIIDSILPENINRFPWAGHFGTQMIGPVADAIAEGETCIVFCNTRSQTEIWFQSILDLHPEWKGKIALHHGSLDREVRDAVEEGLKTGRLRAVIATSSLDLGVDFSPVDRVLQVGSPKGVARLLQRAGRSGHRPGAPSRVTCVPTHALELIDIAAAREAALDGRIESREGINKPLDVLAQHLVTIALGTGFAQEPMLGEVRATRAYRDLSQEEWDWVMDFITQGGSALRAYPEYKRVVEKDGLYRVEDKHIAQRHRMSIGTIVSDAAMQVRFMGGARLGTVEESFLSRLDKGDKFLFAGRPLEFVRIKDMTAWVKPASNLSGAVPRWMGGRLALSGELAHSIRQVLEKAKHGELDSPEMEAIGPLLELQARWSAIPAESELLIERVSTREGHHLFIYPFEGRLVHEGLAALFAYRMSLLKPITFSLACNDYGLELLSEDVAPLEEALDNGLLSPNNLGHDIPASLNSVEMARRQFREIARIAGLVFQGFPGANKSMKQIQASSGLFYDVFQRYDPDNMLLRQARREVLERQLERSRLELALERLDVSERLITEPRRPTPLAFPILVDRLRQTLTSESIPDRIAKMALKLESEAEKD